MNIYLAYLLLKLPTLGSVLLNSGILLLMGTFVFMLLSSEKDIIDHIRSKSNKTLKRIWLGAVLCIVLSVLIPNKEQLYILMGIHLSSELVKTTTGQKVIEMINSSIDTTIDDNLSRTQFTPERSLLESITD